MKRWRSFLLVLGCVLGMGACGEKGGDPATSEMAKDVISKTDGGKEKPVEPEEIYGDEGKVVVKEIKPWSALAREQGIALPHMVLTRVNSPLGRLSIMVNQVREKGLVEDDDFGYRHRVLVGFNGKDGTLALIELPALVETYENPLEIETAEIKRAGSGRFILELQVGLELGSLAINGIRSHRYKIEIPTMKLLSSKDLGILSPEEMGIDTPS